MKKLLIAAALMAAIALASPSRAIEEYLPNEEGYKWQYFGFAEYGHEMTLESITRNTNRTIYQIEGMVEDVSGGEAQGNLKIKLRYTVTDSCLILTHNAPLMMGADFLSMELLRLPLEEGATWTQTVTDEEGNEIELFCEIEEETDQTLTVTYSDTRSPFYHYMEFEKETGITTFEKLYMYPEGNFEIGYTLFRPERY